MTRDGTFWIEDGRVCHPGKNPRFSEEVFEAFRRLEAVSTERWTVAATWGEIGATVAPAFFLHDIASTDHTEF